MAHGNTSRAHVTEGKSHPGQAKSWPRKRANRVAYEARLAKEAGALGISVGQLLAKKMREVKATCVLRRDTVVVSAHQADYSEAEPSRTPSPLRRRIGQGFFSSF